MVSVHFSRLIGPDQLPAGRDAAPSAEMDDAVMRAAALSGGGAHCRRHALLLHVVRFGVSTQMTRRQNVDATPEMDWAVFSCLRLSIGHHVKFDALTSNF